MENCKKKKKVAIAKTVTKERWTSIVSSWRCRDKYADDAGDDGVMLLVNSWRAMRRVYGTSGVRTTVNRKDIETNKR